MTDDGLVYTFKLRPGLRWSNGDPLVAEDFVAGLQAPGESRDGLAVRPGRGRHRQRGATSSPARSPSTALGVSAPDATPSSITLATPAPYLPGLMAHPSTARRCIAPSLAKLGDRFARPGDQVSNGAFVLEEWLQGSFVRAARNPHYRNNAANRSMA